MIFWNLTFVLAEVSYAVFWLIDLFDNFSGVGVFLSNHFNAGPWLLFHVNAAEYAETMDRNQLVRSLSHHVTIMS